MADTIGFNLQVDHQDDFWEAFYQENQLQANSNSESEDQESEDEQILQDAKMQTDPSLMQADNKEVKNQYDE